MDTKQASTNESNTAAVSLPNTRRRFLQVAGTALLASAALPNTAQASRNGGEVLSIVGSSYSLGLVVNGGMALRRSLGDISAVGARNWSAPESKSLSVFE